MITNRGKFTELIVSNSKDPSKIALQLHTGEVLTYGELIQLIDQTQSAIDRFSIKPYERIALISSNSLVYPPLMMAIIENATCVPLDYDLSQEEYVKYYELLGVDYVMCGHLDGAAYDAAVTCGIGIMEFHPDDLAEPTSLQFNLLQKPGSNHDQRQKNAQTAFIFTTSGTTSQPKVVPKLYHDIFAAIQIEEKYFDYTEDSIHLVAVKLFRFPTIWIMLKIFITNSAIIYLDGINPKRIADTMLKFPITHTALPPAGIFALYDYMENNAIVYSTNHHMIITVYGAPLPYTIKNPIEKRLNAHMVDVYGMTEIGVTTSTHKAPKGYMAGSVGCPLAQEIKILDNEVLVKGVGVFAGYENNPEVNRDSFIDGWFRTGDVGYLDEDGYLFIQGRIRELINRGGEKVSPFEIEEAILSLGNIKEVTVFPYPNNHGSDDVGAVIIPYEESPIRLQELRTVLKDKIKPYKLPTLLYTVKEIPRSSANKVQRRYLYRQLQELNLVPETLKNAPVLTESKLTSAQFIIQEIWKTILEQEYVFLDDKFFDLGGDSLSAAELLASIETSFGCILPVNEFFKKSTIRELAELVEETPKFNPYKHIAPIRTGGDKTPLFFIHDLSGDVIVYEYVAEHIDPNRPVYGVKLSFQKEQWNTSITISEIAHAYVDEILIFQATGPYYLGGLSVGGAIAFEMARLLYKRGCEVIVIMFDTFSREYILKEPLNLFKAAFAEIKEVALREKPKLIWKKTKTLCNVLGKKNRALNMKEQDWINEEAESDKSEYTEVEDLMYDISKEYRPKKYRGKLYYFKASKLVNNRSYYDWKSLAGKCVLIQKNCGHADFVKPEFANDTASEINSILG